MDSSINSNEIATLSLLQSRGFGGGGYGYGVGAGGGIGAGVLTAEALANGTATNAKIDANADRASNSIAGVRSAFDNQTRNVQFDQVNQNITNMEFRSLDRQRDIERQIVDNAKDAAKCCCETQKLITSEAATTRTLILEVEARGNVAALAQAQAKITQLETINALSK